MWIPAFARMTKTAVLAAVLSAAPSNEKPAVEASKQ